MTPHFTITEWEAVGRRLRRNYLWLFALLALSWNLKVYLLPLPARDFDVFIVRAKVGLVPGWIVFLIGFVFNAAVLLFSRSAPCDCAKRLAKFCRVTSFHCIH